MVDKLIMIVGVMALPVGIALALTTMGMVVVSAVVENFVNVMALLIIASFVMLGIADVVLKKTGIIN